MTRPIDAPALNASAFWIIDNLMTSFTHEATAATVRYYFPKAQHIQPLTYEQAHEEDFEDSDLRSSYSDRAEWWANKSCTA